MKLLAIAALATTFAISGCSTMQLDDERNLVVEGQAQTVKIVNISSFEVEIAPRKAVCDVTASNGSMIQSECIQYRQTYQRNFNTFNGEIQGFTYEPGFRYVLDLRQEAVADTASGMVKPVWYLNEIVSKNAE